MAPNVTEFVQVRKDGLLMFEQDLYELSQILGRPVPEFEGTQVDSLGDGNLSWLIKSSVRGRIQPPRSKDLICSTMDTTWVDGLTRVMQRLLARLCEEHKDELVGTRFQYFGRRDDEGNPTYPAQHTLFGEYITDMEVLLHDTQENLRDARLKVHFQRSSLDDARVRETQLKWENDNLRLKLARQRRTIVRLRKTVAEQNEMIDEMEQQANEMEEEGEDLRKENSAFISDDEDYLEEMDYEEEDDEEELVDEEEEPSEPVLEEEDPEEPPYDSDVEIVEPEVPPQ
jgi:uncharacterized coiled-coil protein SlyX